MDYKIRDISKEDYEKLKKIAKKEHRSLNGQFLFMVEQSLKADTTSAQIGTEKH